MSIQAKPLSDGLAQFLPHFAAHLQRQTETAFGQATHGGKMRTGQCCRQYRENSFRRHVARSCGQVKMQPAVCMKLRGMGNGRIPVEIIGCGANDVRPSHEIARNQVGIVQSPVAAAYGDVGLIVLQVVQSIAEIKDRTDFGKSVCNREKAV